MPQAESHHTPIPSRRTVIKSSGNLAAALAVSAATTGAAAAAQLSPDAELLAAFKH